MVVWLITTALKKKKMVTLYQSSSGSVAKPYLYAGVGMEERDGTNQCFL
jgi:hypothetical protein